jgi:hypothetical protein
MYSRIVNMKIDVRILKPIYIQKKKSKNEKKFNLHYQAF